MSDGTTNSNPGLPEHITDVLDQVFNNGWDRSSVAEVSTAIESGSPLLTQQVIQQVQNDLELSRYASELPTIARLAELLNEDRPAKKERTQQRIKLLASSFIGVAVTLVVALFGSWVLLNYEQPAIGHIVMQSADVEWADAGLIAGEVVRRDAKLKLNKGIASIELDRGTRIDLIAPAILDLNAISNVHLVTGTLIATVPQQDLGFKVTTVDSEVVDLGTEFIVERRGTFGTRVAVNKGRVKVTLADTDRDGVNVLELTEGRVAQLDHGLQLVKEIGWEQPWDDLLHKTEQARGGIKRVSGAVRSSGQPLSVLTEGVHPTVDHILLVPEEHGLSIQKDSMIVEDLTGPVTLQPNQKFDSYLVHFDPGHFSERPAIGSITFEQPVIAVLHRNEDLEQLDSITSPISDYSQADYRGLELSEDGDIVSLSADRKTISFTLRMEPPHYMDQFRVLVQSP
ncbi:FecR family protein [Calycomorphotria hydatis]|uniref:FecR protein n=1 Tax=Calycomorphotria hydatis TaxID=2528027 RepID=A0A517T5S5_9PLAN|nr:FecR domain-containing protein [Calycomorphotria hydatis]QDT63727.1 FecR protein [Calycomorphotria hydatis]